jgi:hypothetical protein
MVLKVCSTDNILYQVNQKPWRWVPDICFNKSSRCFWCMLTSQESFSFIPNLQMRKLKHKITTSNGRSDIWIHSLPPILCKLTWHGLAMNKEQLLPQSLASNPNLPSMISTLHREANKGRDQLLFSGNRNHYSDSCLLGPQFLRLWRAGFCTQPARPSRLFLILPPGTASLDSVFAFRPLMFWIHPDLLVSLIFY